MSYILFPLSVCCPVCWTQVGQTNGPFSLCAVFLSPVCHVLKGQKTDLFHCPVCLFHMGQADGPFSRFCLRIPSACPVCQTQMGQADWPFSLSRLSHHVLVRPYPHFTGSDIRRSGACVNCEVRKCEVVNCEVACEVGCDWLATRASPRSLPPRIFALHSLHTPPICGCLNR